MGISKFMLCSVRIFHISSYGIVYANEFFFDSRRYLAQSTVSFFVWLCSELSDARWCICKKPISSPPLSALTLIALLRLSGFFPLLPTGSDLLLLMRQVGVLLKRPCVPLRERDSPLFFSISSIPLLGSLFNLR